jgi:hypothetical protein
VAAIEWEFVGHAAEFSVRRNEDRLDVPQEASNPPRPKELDTIAETDGAGDTELTDVRQSLVTIEVGPIDTERELA